MAKPRDIAVKFLADVSSFLRSTSDVSDAYDEIARDSDHAADAGEDSARRLARAYQTAGDKIQRESADTGRDVKRGFGDTGKEAGQEFAQNLGEAVSSGDIGGTLSGTLGGLAGSFGAAGPIGAAFAGLAVLGSTVFSSIQKNAEKAAAAAEDVFQAITTQQTKQAQLESALTRQFGSVSEGFRAIQEAAEAVGIPTKEVTDALAAGGAKADTLITKIKKAEAAHKLALVVGGLQPYDQEIKAQEKLLGIVQEEVDAHRTANAAVRARTAALGTAVQEAQELNRVTRDYPGTNGTNSGPALNRAGQTYTTKSRQGRG